MFLDQLVTDDQSTRYRKSRDLTLPMQECVMVLDHMIQDHDLGAKSHRSSVATRGSQNLASYAREYLALCLESLAETTIVHSFCT